MPPTTAHINGSVNLADPESVMREVMARIPAHLPRLPDGETGERNEWTLFQYEPISSSRGLVPTGDIQDWSEDTEHLSALRVADGVDPADIEWSDFGYANAYLESYEIFAKLKAEGVIGEAVRFQVQYPTPISCLTDYIVPEDQMRVEPSYTKALFADVDKLLAAVPHDQIAVQWDVAWEMAFLEGPERLAMKESRDLDSLVERVAAAVDHIPDDVPVGCHVCYGDYKHTHFTDPKDVGLQVQLINGINAAAKRQAGWYSITVSQDARHEEFFAPLADLATKPGTVYYLGLIPYFPEKQEPGTTDEQIRIVDQYLGDTEWGITNECGLGRVDREKVPDMLAAYTEIIERSARD